MATNKNDFHIMYSLIRIFTAFFVGIFLFLSSCTSNKVKNVSQQELDVDSIIDSQTLLDAYLLNKTEADKKYQGKTIYINGIIEGNSTDDVFLLRDNNTRHGVLCYPNDLQSVQSIRQYDRVTFKGVCYGFLGSNVAIKKCVLINKSN